jgi:hypothetical protein
MIQDGIIISCHECVVAMVVVVDGESIHSIQSFFIANPNYSHCEHWPGRLDSRRKTRINFGRHFDYRTEHHDTKHQE